MFPDKIYYEPDSLNYPLGQELSQKYRDRVWIPIENHNNIEELRQNPNREFTRMKQYLIIGTPVSYTHLDVYKRQRPFSVRYWLKWLIYSSHPN